MAEHSILGMPINTTHLCVLALLVMYRLESGLVCKQRWSNSPV